MLKNFLILTLLILCIDATAQSWSPNQLMEQAAKHGQLQRLQRADALHRDSTGFDGGAYIAFSQKCQAEGRIRLTGAQIPATLKGWADACLPAEFLDLESHEAAAEADVAEAEADAAAKALKARQDSAIAVVRGSRPAEFPDGQFIQAVADMFGITTEDNLLPARVHQIAKHIWSSREAGRLMNVAKEVQDGSWDLAKADRKSPLERLGNSWANQRGGASGVGDYRTCTALGCGAQKMKMDLFERSTRDNH